MADDQEESTRNLPRDRNGSIYDSVEIDSAAAIIDADLVHQTFFKQVLKATAVYRYLLRKGFAPIDHLLLTLNGGTETLEDGSEIEIPGYQKEGYNPVCGTIVESLADNLKWEMCVVTNTYETTDQDDEPVTALTAMTPHSKRLRTLEHGNDPDEVRPPQAAIRALWGESPELWKQHQLIQAEAHMRFEQYHCFDFEEVDWKSWIKARFEHWVGCTLSAHGTEELPDRKKDPKNKAFQAYFKKQTVGAQHALFDFVVEPFEMMDSVVNDWFDEFDENVSCYTYLSFLGKDWLMCTICFLIQFVLPITLGLSSFRAYSDMLESDEFESDNNFYCSKREGRDVELARTTLVAVLAFYAISVVPNYFAVFKKRLGVSGDSQSKMNRLRTFVFLQGDDDLSMKIGFRLDMLMNSTYVCMLYLFNIVVLYTYDDPWDIILNSLAIEFIKDIDEAFTKGEGYDSEYRFLKAGIIEMVIRRYVNLHSLNERFFSKAPERKVIVEGQKEKSIVPIMSNEIVEKTVGKVHLSEVEDQSQAMDEMLADTVMYCDEPKVHFYSLYTWLNMLERRYRDQHDCLHALVNCARYCLPRLTYEVPLFNKWAKFRRSDRVKGEWEKLIYPGEKESGEEASWISIPKTESRLNVLKKISSTDDWDKVLEKVSDKDNVGSALEVLENMTMYIDSEDQQIFERIRAGSKVEQQTTSMVFRELKEILLFRRLGTEIRTALGDVHSTYQQRLLTAAFYVFSALIEWLSICIQLCFPFIFAFLFFYAPACY